MQAPSADTVKQTTDAVKALAPLFAAGFAIQQLTEILGGAFSKVSPDQKKLVIKVSATIVGLIIVYFGGLRVLKPLGYEVTAWIDYPLAGLIVGGGTEGVNSVMKFLGYAKEDKKASAGIKQADATPNEQAAIAKMANK